MTIGFAVRPKVQTIGRLAQATGTNVETIRFYDRIGILPPPARTDGTYRCHDPSHLNRLSFIRRARDLNAIKTELDRIIDTGRCGTVEERRIIETLSSMDRGR